MNRWRLTYPLAAPKTLAVIPAKAGIHLDRDTCRTRATASGAKKKNGFTLSRE
jgi:hypothetical protein